MLANRVSRQPTGQLEIKCRNPNRHAERVGRKQENRGSKPTTISVGFRGTAILDVFSIRVRVTAPE